MQVTYLNHANSEISENVNVGKIQEMTILTRNNLKTYNFKKENMDTIILKKESENQRQFRNKAEN